MLAGHFGLGLIVHALLRPSFGLGLTLFGAQVMDLLSTIFTAVGAEFFVYNPALKGQFFPMEVTGLPLSHSIFGVMAGFTIASSLRRTSLSTKDAVSLFLIIFSHWCGDVLVHRKGGMTLFPLLDTPWNHVHTLQLFNYGCEFNAALEGVLVVVGLLLWMLTSSYSPKTARNWICLIAFAVISIGGTYAQYLSYPDVVEQYADPKTRKLVFPPEVSAFKLSIDLGLILLGSLMQSSATTTTSTTTTQQQEAKKKKTKKDQ